MATAGYFRPGHRDADGLRDIVREYGVENLATQDAVLVIDQTGFLSRARHLVVLRVNTQREVVVRDMRRDFDEHKHVIARHATLTMSPRCVAHLLDDLAHPMSTLYRYIGTQTRWPR